MLVEFNIGPTRFRKKISEDEEPTKTSILIQSTKSIEEQNSNVQLAFKDIIASILLALKEPGTSLYNVFDTFNIDGSRCGISRDEFVNFIAELGIGGKLSSVEHAALFECFDRDCDGTIDFKDFESTLRSSLPGH